jgi:hypothetical protein
VTDKISLTLLTNMMPGNIYQMHAGRINRKNIETIVTHMEKHMKNSKSVAALIHIWH